MTKSTTDVLRTLHHALILCRSELTIRNNNQDLRREIENLILMVGARLQTYDPAQKLTLQPLDEWRYQTIGKPRS